MIIKPIIAVVVLANAAVSGALACFSSGPGYGLGHDELIDSAQNIYLARVEKITAAYSKTDDFLPTLEEKFFLPRTRTEYDTSYYSIFQFEIVEVLKGKLTKIGPIEGSKDDYSGNDFADHADSIFWSEAEDVGRSEWFGGECQPRHVFKLGELYLLFPGKLSSRKSAEVIRKPSDLWLRYVVERIALSEEK